MSDVRYTPWAGVRGRGRNFPRLHALLVKFGVVSLCLSLTAQQADEGTAVLGGCRYV